MSQSAFKPNTGGGLGNDTVTLTALEDVQQGDSIAVATASTGEEAVKAAFFRRPHSGAPSGTESFEEIIDMIEVDTDKFAILYDATGTTGTGIQCYIVIANVDRDTMSVSFGSTVRSIPMRSGTEGNMAKMDTDSFIVAVAEGNLDAQVYLFSVSGTTISYESDVQTTSTDMSKAACCAVDTNKFAFFFTTGGQSNGIIGFGTVSGTTLSITDSTTTIDSTMLDEPRYGMASIATDKFVLTEGSDANAIIGDTSGSTLSLGSVASIGGSPQHGSTEPLQMTEVVSEGNNTFWARFKGELSYCTVSGTTITLEDNINLPGDSGGNLIIKGSTVYDIFKSSSEPNGIYRSTFGGGSITREALYGGDMEASVGAKMGTNFYMFFDTTGTHIEGCSSEFLGFSTSDASAGTTLTVDKEKSTNQSGLTPGALYKPDAGGLTITVDKTEPHLTKAVSDTRADVL